MEASVRENGGQAKWYVAYAEMTVNNIMSSKSAEKYVIYTFCNKEVITIYCLLILIRSPANGPLVTHGYFQSRDEDGGHTI